MSWVTLEQKIENDQSFCMFVKGDSESSLKDDLYDINSEWCQKNHYNQEFLCIFKLSGCCTRHFFVNFILMGVGHSSCIGHTTPPPHMDSKCDRKKHLTLVNIELEITHWSLESGLFSPEAEEYASNFAAFRVKTNVSLKNGCNVFLKQ